MFNHLIIKPTTLSALVMLALLPLSYTPLTIAQPLTGLTNGASEKQHAAEADTININAASASELANQLKGIGVKRAEQIVALREQLGGFKTIDELQQVRGIGPIFIANNKHRLRIEN